MTNEELEEKTVAKSHNATGRFISKLRPSCKTNANDHSTRLPVTTEKQTFALTRTGWE